MESFRNVDGKPRQRAWRRSKTEVDVLGCLRLIVFNRLCDPGSKLGVLRWTPAQKSLFAALELTPPTPADLVKPVL